MSVYRRIGVIYTWEELSERHAGRISTGQRQSVEQFGTSLGMRCSARQGVPAANASGLRGARVQATRSGPLRNG